MYTKNILCTITVIALSTNHMKASEQNPRSPSHLRIPTLDSSNSRLSDESEEISSDESDSSIPPVSPITNDQSSIHAQTIEISSDESEEISLEESDSSSNASTPPTSHDDPDAMQLQTQSLPQQRSNRSQYSQLHESHRDYIGQAQERTDNAHRQLQESTDDDESAPLQPASSSHGILSLAEQRRLLLELEAENTADMVQRYINSHQIINNTHRPLSERNNDDESTPLQSASSSPIRRKVTIWYPSKQREQQRIENKLAPLIPIARRKINRMLLLKNIKTIRDAAVINAIKDNDASELQRLIKKNCPVNAQWNGQTALLLAAHDSRISCLKVLLNNGADANYKDEDGNSLLYLMSYKGHDACALLLKKSGAHHIPVRHLGKKVGDIIPMLPTDYFKNLSIDSALIRAARKKK